MIVKPNAEEIEMMFYVQLCIKALYQMNPSGGCCHIVTDDDNIEDEDLQWVIDKCQSTEWADRPDRLLSKCICEQLLTLKREYRIILFDCMNYDFFNNIDNVAIDIYFDTKDVEKVVRDWDNN